MTLVTNTLLKTISHNLKKSGTLVWYDPEHAYTELAASLTPAAVAGAAIFRYQPDRGFLWLRHQLEPHWQADTVPNLLIYVPLAQPESHQALIEFEVAGAVLQPGMQPPEQNTALAVIARQALQQVFPPAAVADMVQQVEAGQLTLAELDRQSEKGLEGQAGVINALFGSGNATEVALRFLADPKLDDEINNRQALAPLSGLMAAALSIAFAANDRPAALRAQLARHILLTDLLEALGADTPPALQTIPQAETAVARETAVALARTWRNRLDLQASYGEWAGKIQAEIGLTALHLPLRALARTHTFATAEQQLQTEVETALLRPSPAKSLVELAQQRINSFWSAQEPVTKLRWQIVADAGQVLWEADRVEKAIKGSKGTAESLLARYAFGEERSAPWCVLDSYQRHLERDFHRFDVDHAQHQSLVKLVANARARYAAVAGNLAEQFVRAYEQQRFELPQILLQADLFREMVFPFTQQGKTAYILVDALRFEMAHELLTMLDDGWQAQLNVALATPPTITEIGMAALMPGAEKGLSFSEAGGKLLPVVEGQPLRTRAERVQKFLAAFPQQTPIEVKLDQLAPLANNRLAGQLKDATVILVTATEEIDGLCENNPALARRMLDDVFNQLRRSLKTLFGLGVKTIVVTADHGYLFGEEIATGSSLDAPGGHKALLKRRVWVGKGGAALPGTLRQPLAAFGINSDLELVTPYNLACFKVPGGALSYFHGGLSLPELAIPVLTVRAGKTAVPAPGAAIHWSLTAGSKRITTRFVTVTVSGQTTELLPMQPPVVRVEIQAGNRSVSVPVAASYGFQDTTKDVQLVVKSDDARTIEPNTITLLITEDITVDTVTIHLLDAATGSSLSRLENVPVEIML